MIIRPATVDDIAAIHEIEVEIEGQSDAASQETLIARLRLFPYGFNVASEGDRVVGYLESLRWDGFNFAQYGELDFQKQHNPDGIELYIHYLARTRRMQSSGIGSSLVRNSIGYAQQENLVGITLVAGDWDAHAGIPLSTFYEHLGFSVVKELPEWLPGHTGTLMRFDTSK